MEEDLLRLETLEKLTTTPEGLLLLGAPILLLALVVVVIVALTARKRRAERAELEKEMELPETPVESAPESLLPAEEERLPSEVEEIRASDRRGWLARLAQGLAKTRAGFEQSLAGLFSGRARLDEETLEKLHEGLFRADVGVATADKLVDHVRRVLPKDKDADWSDVSRALKDCAAELMAKAEGGSIASPSEGPLVILIVGVNGVGKTTSIGKLAAHFLAEDKTVLLAAGDTFRAAAIEQLSVWAERLGVDVVKHQQGSDPAAVAFDAVKAAKARGTDVVIIDTAGRLHSKTDLMQELGKINKVVKREIPEAPHETWLVIDATTGQNAVQQVKAFGEVVKLTGLVVTKLDGTAKGGVLIGIADQFGLPIRFVGVGEKASDLRPFDVKAYVDALF